MNLQIIVALAVGLGLALLVLVHEARRRADFVARFPPISDAEFVRQCIPGTNPDVALKVRRIVADNLGEEYERIYPSSRFIQDLGAD